MAKKSEQTQVKVFFGPNELRLIKFAAVNRGVTASDFIRTAALSAAGQEMQDFDPQSLTQESASGRSKRRS